MKTSGGGEFILNILDLELHGGEESASRPGRFAIGVTAGGRWMGRRSSLDAVEKRKT
jgi:hypothetical protein